MAYCGMVRWAVGWRGGALYIMYNVDGLKDFPKMLSWIKIPAVFWSCFFPPFTLLKDIDACCFLNFALRWRSAGLVSGSCLNFTGLRNSRFTGNTDHLAQACNRPEVGQLSPHLLTTSVWLLKRWGCQGERVVPQGGLCVIDQWNRDSASSVFFKSLLVSVQASRSNKRHNCFVHSNSLLRESNHCVNVLYLGNIIHIDICSVTKVSNS